MEMTRDVLQRHEEGIFRSCFGREFFLLTSEGQDSVCHLDELPPTRRIVRAPVPGGALDGLKRVKARFEVELFLMLSPIAEAPKSEPPYFPFALLLADSETGAILGMELLSTRNGVEEAYARIPETLIQVLKRVGVKPAVLAARHPVLLSLLDVFSSAYGISCESDENLDAVDEAMDSLMGFLSKGRR